MIERDKTQKAFMQCSDALGGLDQRSIMKVFHLLSIHFDLVPIQTGNNIPSQPENQLQVTYLPKSGETSSFEEAHVSTKKTTKKIGSSNPTVNKKSKNGHSKNPIYLSDFDFRPSHKESLREFYTKYKASSNMENNLIFNYYLQEILALNDISINHIYSCYRHLGLKIPQFPQTLADTKARKGWIESANSSDLKVTREGINYLEHEMAKNNGE
jgi:hypothetical protein